MTKRDPRIEELCCLMHHYEVTVRDYDMRSAAERKEAAQWLLMRLGSAPAENKEPSR